MDFRFVSGCMAVNYEPSMVFSAFEKATSDPEHILLLLVFEWNAGRNSSMNEQIIFYAVIEGKRTKPIYSF